MAADRPTGTAVFAASDSPIGNIASLDSKVALITGASTGLGRAIALAYAAAGAYVVSADLTPDPAPAPIVEATQKELDHKTPTVELVNDRWPAQSDPKGKGQGLGKRAAYVKCDVTDESSVKNAVAFAVDTFGRLDIMVNNAGISAESSREGFKGVPQRIHETDVNVLDKSLAINVRGVWLGTKHAVAQFLTQKPRDPSLPDRGWVINLGSIFSSVGSPGISSYCASKGAVLQITRATALEYARDGIHINAIQPGYTDTHLLENMYEKMGTENVHQSLNTLHPWGRTGKPADIARIAVFLAGEGAGWVTGIGVVVDGGYLAK